MAGNQAAAGSQAAAGNQDAVLRVLLDRYGRSYATEAGIKLADRPAPLYQLLVLETLLSARITSGIAVAAARQLFAAGYRTAQAMTGARWQDRVNASAAVTTGVTTRARRPGWGRARTC